MLKDQRSHIMLTYFTFSIPSLPPSFFGLAVLWFEFIFAVTNLLTEIIFIFLHKLKQISHPTPATANESSLLQNAFFFSHVLSNTTFRPNGLQSLRSIVRLFQTRLFHFIVRLFHSFSVKVYVKHAFFGFLGLKDWNRYTHK